MRPEYAAAFERQLEWLRWDASPEADEMWAKAPAFGIKGLDRTGVIDPAGMIRARRFYRDPLLYGDVYYVAPRIHDWLIAARASGRLPDLPLDTRWCPSEYGFVVLSKRLDLSAGAGMMTPMSVPTRGTVAGAPVEIELVPKANESTVHALAFGWIPSPDGLEVVFYSDRLAVDLRDGVLTAKANEMLRAHPEITDLAHTDPDAPVRLRFFADEVTAVTTQEGFYPIAWMDVPRGYTWRAAAKLYREIAASAKDIGATTEHADIEIAYLYAFLMFVNDRRVVRRRHRADRAARKRAVAIRPRPSEHITVIALRAEEEAAFDGRDPESAPLPRTYTVRWNVREHTRRHPRTGEKTVHVRPYVKGPPDAPFKDDQRRIFAVVR